MTLTLEQKAHVNREYHSGEVVEPGLYRDVETGSLVRVYEPDTLPVGVLMVRYQRRFRRIEPNSEPTRR